MGIELAIGLMAASGGLSAIGQFSEAQTQKASLSYQGDVADYNADIAEQNAQAATEQGRLEAKQGNENKLLKRQEAGGIVASQRAAMSASGALLDTGSLLDVNLDTVEQAERDALKMEQEGFDKQYKYDVQAQSYTSQASAYRAEADAYNAKSSSINPLLQMGTSLLGTAAQGANMFYMAGK